MIQIFVASVLARTIGSLLTLYMMMILLRWTASWLQLDAHDRRVRWMWRLTDPLINAIRRVLPPMGPMDFGPLAALFVVWVVRAVAVGLLMAGGRHGAPTMPL